MRLLLGSICNRGGGGHCLIVIFSVHPCVIWWWWWCDALLNGQSCDALSSQPRARDFPNLTNPTRREREREKPPQATQLHIPRRTSPSPSLHLHPARMHQTNTQASQMLHHLHKPSLSLVDSQGRAVPPLLPPPLPHTHHSLPLPHHRRLTASDRTCICWAPPARRRVRGERLIGHTPLLGWGHPARVAPREWRGGRDQAAQSIDSGLLLSCA